HTSHTHSLTHTDPRSPLRGRLTRHRWTSFTTHTHTLSQHGVLKHTHTESQHRALKQHTHTHTHTHTHKHTHTHTHSLQSDELRYEAAGVRSFDPQGHIEREHTREHSSHT